MLKKNIHIKFNKRSLMSLEALVGTILSSIALIFIVSQFVNIFFMETPTNEKIVSDNMNSINEFIEFSHNKYEKSFGNGDCFTVLKLKNLENFQFDKNNNQKFFILITKDIIASLPMTELQKVKSKINQGKFNWKNVKTLKKDKLNFPVDHLILDKTTDNLINLDFYFWTLNSNSGLNLKKNLNVEYLVLVPNYDKYVFNNFFGQFSIGNVGPIKSNENILLGFSYILTNTGFNDIEYNLGNYLVYNPKKNDLFLSNSYFSNTLINHNNCEFNNLQRQVYLNSIQTNFNNVDYINNKVVFDFYNKDFSSFFGFNFIWSIAGIECPTSEGKSCEDYLGKDYNTLSYDDFLTKINEIGLNKYKKQQFELRIKNLELLSLNKITSNVGKFKSKKNLDYPIKNVFIKLDGIDKDLYLETNRGRIKEKLIKNFGVDEENIFKFNTIVGSKKDNEPLISNYVVLKDGKTYFYSDELKSMVEFNVNYIVKNEIAPGNFEYYYLGKKIFFENNGEKLGFDSEDVGQPFDDHDFYVIHIDIGGKSRRLFLTELQLMSINNYYKNDLELINNQDDDYFNSENNLNDDYDDLSMISP